MAQRKRERPLRIANAGGYWGDDASALRRQLESAPPGGLDYVNLDFLAELTLAILQKQRARDPLAGYARDFVAQAVDALGLLAEKRVRVITNAGGGNPLGCARAIAQAAAARGLHPRIAVVLGDDFLASAREWHREGIAFSSLETGQPFSEIEGKLTSAHAYLGAKAIARALEEEPDIVVTGRVTDAALTLGPCWHEFGWGAADWDAIAGATVAGHLLECGSQVTGGNFTDWHTVPGLSRLGYPIAEIAADGSFTLTKTPGTGGRVSPHTVAEQLLYEIDDPAAYLTPDVTVDFTGLQLAEDGPDRVTVRGARGFCPPTDYKAAMTFDAGFKISGSLLVGGPEAAAKAEACAEIFWSRFPAEPRLRATEFIGRDAFHRTLGGRGEAEEICVRFAARGARQADLSPIAKAIPAMVLGGPPGITVEGSLPAVTEILGYWPSLVPRSRIQPQLVVLEKTGERGPTAVECPALVGAPAPGTPSALRQTALRVLSASARGESGTVLRDLCLARSGDKGNRLNLGVIARSADAYRILREKLTAQWVKDRFQAFCQGPVTRYEIPKLTAFNFVLEQALDGGGMLSLRADALGKTLGQALLRQHLDVSA
jgi:hypothetical protein